MSAGAVIWINGERFAGNAPHVSAVDRGLTLADGVFETLRVRRRVAFRIPRHLDRLRRSLEVLQIPAPSDMRGWIDAAIAACGAEDAAMRITVTRGTGPGGVSPPASPSPTVIVAVNPFPMFPGAIYESGLSVQVAAGRRNERSLANGLKTLCYTDAVLAMIAASRAGAGDALFLDTEGHCSEATASNLFAWTGDALVTPPVSCGALPGITREAVFELAASLGLPAHERPFGLDDLLASGEAFLTSSLRGIAPLVRVDGRAIGDGAPGPHTRAVAAAYAALVDRECR